MSRRLLVAVGLAVALAVATVAVVTLGAKGSGHPSPSAPSRPNVLIIVTDDQREGLDVMPNTTARFVDQGTSYPNAIVTTPECCPSRASIMTGRYAHNHGVRSNAQSAALGLDQATTAQAALHASGYRTGLIGKYLNGWPLDRNPPSFDTWAMFNRSGNPGAYLGGQWNVDGTVRTVTEYSTSFIADRAVGFIGERSSRPWFLYVATAAPHLPAIPEPRYANAPVPAWNGDPAVGERDRSDKPAYVRGTDRGLAVGRAVRQRMERTLMSVDDLVGRIFAELASTGQLQDTLAFFLSDNGYFWGEHGLIGKEAPYLQALRVPFLARWPGHLTAGAVDGRLVANIDIAPTIAQATGLSMPNVDGRSLLDRSWKRDAQLAEFWRTGRVPTWASLITPRLQYVEYYADDGRKVMARELYDLARDPWELTNTFMRRVPSLEEELSRLRNCRESSCR